MTAGNTVPRVDPARSRTGSLVVSAGTGLLPEDTVTLLRL